MKFSIVTLFPESIRPYLESSLLGRAVDGGILSVEVINPRDYADDPHHKVDDKPYGGGPGMVMKVEPIIKAVERIEEKKQKGRSKIIIFSPSGLQFTGELVRKWAKKFDHFILIAGRYEGIDARVKKILKADEISVGPYVLSGGELPALIVLEVMSRYTKGVMGKEESLEERRHGIGVPTYTRPPIFVSKGKAHRVPEVLLTGNHKKIEEWKIKMKKPKS